MKPVQTEGLVRKAQLDRCSPSQPIRMALWVPTEEGQQTSTKPKTVHIEPWKHSIKGISNPKPQKVHRIYGGYLPSATARVAEPFTPSWGGIQTTKQKSCSIQWWCSMVQRTLHHEKHRADPNWTSPCCLGSGSLVLILCLGHLLMVAMMNPTKGASRLGWPSGSERFTRSATGSIKGIRFSYLGEQSGEGRRTHAASKSGDEWLIYYVWCYVYINIGFFLWRWIIWGDGWESCSYHNWILLPIWVVCDPLMRWMQTYYQQHEPVGNAYNRIQQLCYVLYLYML